ncbi:hypothetical protein [Qaidamihabitans albus]|uniref:hypothetical protein n=1 Tax=Qaidamihabitans albus TaxID=2795733 RepID=UPI001F1DE0C7|nr:hypothetical protein [Qaidamihabitans albus]
MRVLEPLRHTFQKLDESAFLDDELVHLGQPFPAELTEQALKHSGDPEIPESPSRSRSELMLCSSAVANALECVTQRRPPLSRCRRPPD